MIFVVGVLRTVFLSLSTFFILFVPNCGSREGYSIFLFWSSSTNSEVGFFAFCLVKFFPFPFVNPFRYLYIT